MRVPLKTLQAWDEGNLQALNTALVDIYAAINENETGDADTVDGYHSTAFLSSAGCAVDSDKVDGYHSTAFLPSGDHGETNHDSGVLDVSDSAQLSGLTQKSTPEAKDVLLIEDSAASYAKKKLYVEQVRPIYNCSTAQQTGFSAQTYLTGSNVLIPDNSLQIGSIYHLIFDVSKTAAGVAAPIIYVRFGTTATTADTAILTLTFAAQTAALDDGTFDVYVVFRAVGSGTSAVAQGRGQCRHRAAATGLQNLDCKTVVATSSGFDCTVSSSYIGVSVNAGTSAVWTVELVQAKLENLT